ncbi:MAG: Fic/DOC family N-terminal domain-containing protein [Armatimonadota bacterium]
MDPMQFTSQRTGVVVSIPGGLHAFMPNHLPPVIEIYREMLSLLSLAERTLGGLDAAVGMLPNPALALTPLLLGEMAASCRIEGGKMGWDEALQLVLEEVCEDCEEHDILNCLDTLQVGQTDLASVPFTAKLIQRLHFGIMAGARGAHASPGDYRQIQVFVGARNNRLSTAS